MAPKKLPQHKKHLYYAIAKAVVTALRHDNKRELTNRMDRHGWVLIRDLCNLRGVKSVAADGVHPADMRHILEDDNKPKVRFEFFDEEAPGGPITYVRAIQGHSRGMGLDYETILRRVFPRDDDWANVGVHGTSRSAWSNIVLNGLRTMGREHVHMVRSVVGGQQAGLRSGSEMGVRVNLTALHSAGAVVYLSPNDVFLSSGLGGVIPPQFLMEVFEIGTGMRLWPFEGSVPRRLAEAVAQEPGIRDLNIVFVILNSIIK